MMFLYTLRFNIEEQKAKLFRKFYSYHKIEAVREKKDKKPDEIKIELISDAKE